MLTARQGGASGDPALPIQGVGPHQGWGCPPPPRISPTPRLTFPLPGVPLCLCTDGSPASTLRKSICVRRGEPQAEGKA